MAHREETEFSIHLHLSAEFPEEYEGEEDGLAWRRIFDHEVRPRVIAGVMEALRSPGWRAHASHRGRNPSTAIDIEVERKPT